MALRRERSAVRKPARGRRQPVWARWPDEKLLDLRFCDLELRIEGSGVEARIQQLYRELDQRGLRFRPHFWFSDDWFTPDGVPGSAIPFYLGHPRLARLEESQMLEVEGGTREWCMRILRHETGHAIDNAYRLRRRRWRQKLFGKSSHPYPEYYAPRPYSRSYVLHLEPWYAQSHPDEDFAETFAVWLHPRSRWRKRYAGWPVLRKLEYVDGLMCEIGPRTPLVQTRLEVDPFHRLKKTLREHYREKRDRYGIEYPNVYDRDLRRLFSDAAGAAGNTTAAQFVQRVRDDVRRTVACWTGEYQYTIKQVLDDIARRCRELRLHLALPEERAKVDFTVMVAVHVRNYIHSGQHRVWL